jgi:hypothetical protein
VSVPDLQEKVRTERIRATFDDFSEWLQDQADSERVLPHDSQAVAAVALSSLAFFRFVCAWTQMIAAALS